MSDLVRREDVLNVLRMFGWTPIDGLYLVVKQDIPSADRPQGDVDAVDIFDREMHNLEQGYITIGEFDKRIEPLRHLCYGRPQGEWIEHKEKTIVRDNNFIDFFPTEYECSNCGLRRATYFINSPLSNYCPNCGARMKGADDE